MLVFYKTSVYIRQKQSLMIRISITSLTPNTVAVISFSVSQPFWFSRDSKGLVSIPVLSRQPVSFSYFIFPAEKLQFRVEKERNLFENS